MQEEQKHKKVLSCKHFLNQLSKGQYSLICMFDVKPLDFGHHLCLFLSHLPKGLGESRRWQRTQWSFTLVLLPLSNGALLWQLSSGDVSILGKIKGPCHRFHSWDLLISTCGVSCAFWLNQSFTAVDPKWLIKKKMLKMNQCGFIFLTKALQARSLQTAGFIKTFVYFLVNSVLIKTPQPWKGNIYF